MTVKPFYKESYVDIKEIPVEKAPYLAIIMDICSTCEEEGNNPDSSSCIYFDNESFHSFFECEVNTDHNHIMEGKWNNEGDVLALGIIKEEAIQAAKKIWGKP